MSPEVVHGHPSVPSLHSPEGGGGVLGPPSATSAGGGKAPESPGSPPTNPILPSAPHATTKAGRSARKANPMLDLGAREDERVVRVTLGFRFEEGTILQPQAYGRFREPTTPYSIGTFVFLGKCRRPPPPTLHESRPCTLAARRSPLAARTRFREHRSERGTFDACVSPCARRSPVITASYSSQECSCFIPGVRRAARPRVPRRGLIPRPAEQGAGCHE